MISNERLNYRALIASLWTVVFIVAPQSANIFLLGGNLEQITQSLCLANIPVINAVVKLIVTWYCQKDLKPLVKSFYDDWYRSKSEEEKATMMRNANLTKNISTWCTILSQLMVTIYIGLRTVTIVTCDRSKVTQDNLVLYPGYFPYNVRQPIVLLLTNLSQAFAAYCATIPYTSVDTFIAMLVLHTCGQFENLRRRLERLMDDKNGTRNVHQIKKQLASIVKRHEHLNCIVHIYIYCYVGEALLVESSAMGSSAYKSNWFNVSPPEAKCLIFIMCSATRPLCLTGGKFGTFSMEMFSTILRTALGYLSVLLTVTGGND
ncbi:odorant receptor 13a-like [Colletes latitarsis]|uniref:odorant receptor 13a-like n=1 Tax=Colletes latitarsis TaxID=2605962 RepID=UPI004036ED7D